MRKIASFLVAVLFVASAALLGANLNANAAGTSSQMNGTITLVGNNVVTIVDDAGNKHQLKISEAQEAELTTGYNVTFQAKNGQLVSFTQMSPHENVQEFVYTQSNLPSEGATVVIPPKEES